MESLAGSRTEQNLLKAFAGESQARNRYEFFSKQAKAEGLEQIAALFMETAENERSHAKQFFKQLEGRMVEITATYPAGKIGTTLENLKAAADGEQEEWTELYPEFARIAEEEGFKKVAVLFKSIAKIEKSARRTLPQVVSEPRRRKSIRARRKSGLEMSCLRVPARIDKTTIAMSCLWPFSSLFRN